MKLFRGLPFSSPDPQALAIGNFDGVHIGHQAMLKALRATAVARSWPAAVLTFIPAPREFFNPKQAPARLSTLRDKLQRFAENGIDRVYLARFNAALARLTADEFIDRVLLRALRTKWLIVGDDFHFGRDRQGTIHTLRQRSQEITVALQPTVSLDAQRVSSSAVRKALAEDDLYQASQMLGRPYSLSGRVAHGRKLGRDLGFPTANIALRGKPAVAGIYAVRIQGLSAQKYGVASVGVRPAVTASEQPVLEVYIFDFNQAIYGERITVEFMSKLRNEEKYASLSALQQQIARDVQAARDYFSEYTGG